MKKACGGCPENKCHNCPVKDELFERRIEKAAIQSAQNMGAAEKMWIPDPDTGEMVFVDLKNPSDQAILVLEKIYGTVE